MKVKKFDTMNVVPFIDIMLVLLVIVLTTASFVAHGFIPVDLSAAKSSQKIKDQKNITITIKQNGEIYFDKKMVVLEDIESKLTGLKQNIPINLNCDKNVKFEKFVQVIDILKDKNFTNLSIITKK